MRYAGRGTQPRDEKPCRRMPVQVRAWPCAAFYTCPARTRATMRGRVIHKEPRARAKSRGPPAEGPAPRGARRPAHSSNKAGRPWLGHRPARLRLQQAVAVRAGSSRSGREIGDVQLARGSVDDPPHARPRWRSRADRADRRHAQPPVPARSTCTSPAIPACSGRAAWPAIEGTADVAHAQHQQAQRLSHTRRRAALRPAPGLRACRCRARNGSGASSTAMRWPFSNARNCSSDSTRSSVDGGSAANARRNRRDRRRCRCGAAMRRPPATRRGPQRRHRAPRNRRAAEIQGVAVVRVQPSPTAFGSNSVAASSTERRQRRHRRATGKRIRHRARYRWPAQIGSSPRRFTTMSPSAQPAMRAIRPGGRCRTRAGRSSPPSRRCPRPRRRCARRRSSTTSPRPRLRAAHDVNDERLAAERAQRLARQARSAEARRDRDDEIRISHGSLLCAAAVRPATRPERLRQPRLRRDAPAAFVGEGKRTSPRPSRSSAPAGRCRSAIRPPRRR